MTSLIFQGNCGACWAFSATGSLEGQYFINTGTLVSFSEQQLVDCSSKQKIIFYWHYYNIPASFGNNGCKGGLMDNAFRYLETVDGDETEEEYPYLAEVNRSCLLIKITLMIQDGHPCQYNSSKAIVRDTVYKDIPNGDEGALQEAVATVGPVSVSIDSEHSSFQVRWHII